jgi:hypothetical protein
VEPIDIFSLEKHRGPYELWPSTTALYMHGRPSGARVPGYVLEAQYRCGDRYLLGVSYDCPFEEIQTFLLLSADLKILSQKHYGCSLAIALPSVCLEGHEPLGADTVIFHCDNGRDVVITVRERRPFGLGSLLQKRVLRTKTQR